MIFTPTKLDGAWLIEIDLSADYRSFFAPTSCGFGIEWPQADRTIGPRDQQYPSFRI